MELNDHNRWTDEAIIEEHRFTRALADLEIPVVPPILAERGNSPHQHGLYRFALYRCCGGREPELDNPDHLKHLGRFIGRIHALGVVIRFEYRPELSIDNFGVKPRDFLLATPAP